LAITDTGEIAGIGHDSVVANPPAPKSGCGLSKSIRVRPLQIDPKLK
jgi:hypothetical protein